MDCLVVPSRWRDAPPSVCVCVNHITFTQSYTGLFLSDRAIFLKKKFFLFGYVQLIHPFGPDYKSQ